MYICIWSDWFGENLYDGTKPNLYKVYSLLYIVSSLNNILPDWSWWSKWRGMGSQLSSFKRPFPHYTNSGGHLSIRHFCSDGRNIQRASPWSALKWWSKEISFVYVSLSFLDQIVITCCIKHLFSLTCTHLGLWQAHSQMAWLSQMHVLSQWTQPQTSWN